jgi:hypothetical protein
MKFSSPNRRHGIFSARAVFALAAAILIPLLVYAGVPSWWSQRGILVSDASADDYAPVNQGQLKNIATAAVAEMDARLPGGAGDTVHNLVDGWSSPTSQPNDFAPVNLGQLKNVAKPFYDRLISVGLAADYPWVGASPPPNDFSVANIGQVKNLFNFNPAEIDPLYDGDGNGLPDAWERHYFGRVGVNPNADDDGDGLTNLQEFQQGTDPTDYYNGTTPSLAIVGGDNQQGDGGTYAPDALMIEVRNSAGQLLSNAPVTFDVPQGSGTLAATAELMPQGTSISGRTGSNGLAMAYFTFPSVQNYGSSITCTAGAVNGIVSEVFHLRTTDLPVPQPMPRPSPTASPNPSATPPPVLHYALIDLGKGVFPTRIANNGWILASSSYLGVCRWKDGVLEPLSYSDSSIYWEATDINSTGTVVGTLYPSGDISSGQDTELAAGLIWQPGSSVAQTRVSAPFVATTPALDRPVQVRGARFNAITDAGTIFGGIYTGWGYNSLITRVPNPIVNYYRWSANGTGPQALTSGTASLVGYYGPWPITRVNGAVADPSEYAPVRANSTGHYVGQMLVPGADPTSPVETGMIDGRSVTFQPVDINESGIVAAFSEDYSGMVVINADGTRRDIAGANPAAINAFVRPGVDGQGQANQIPAPQILGWWFKDYVSGWLPSVWEYAPNGEWVVHSLDELISNSAGWYIPNFNVQDINDEGMIVGYGDFTDPTNPQAQQEGHGFMLVPVAISPDAGVEGYYGGTVASNLGATGESHFVSPPNLPDYPNYTQAEDYITFVAAGITPELFAAYFKWENCQDTCGEEVSNASKNKRRVKRVDARKNTLRILTQTGDKEVAKLNVWIVSSTITPDSTAMTQPALDQQPNINGLVYRANLSYNHTISPPEILTENDRPKLLDPNGFTPPPGGKTGCIDQGTGNEIDLGLGAQLNWDVSRQFMFSKTQSSSFAFHLDCPQGKYSAFPNDNVIGNDDGSFLGETDNPETAQNHVLVDPDNPSMVAWSIDGSPGDWAHCTMFFREFTRLCINKTWYRVSMFHNSSVNFNFLKVQQGSVSYWTLDPSQQSLWQP